MEEKKFGAEIEFQIQFGLIMLNVGRAQESKEAFTRALSLCLLLKEKEEVSKKKSVPLVAENFDVTNLL